MIKLDPMMISRALAAHVCIYCGERYTPKPVHASPRRVYCCQACQKKAWRRDVKA